MLQVCITTKYTYMNKTTMKGKHAISYKVIGGVRISTWVHDLGGYEIVRESITKNILDGMCRIQIASYYNITVTTTKTFIKKQLPMMCDIEGANFLKNSKQRRISALKGKTTKFKGMTYDEIYKGRQVNCGFKKGDLNPNFTRPKFIGCKKINKFGEKYRSTYEVFFSEKLHDLNIKFKYEDHFKLKNGKIKIVDFVVKNFLIEITAYAYKEWQDDFDAKVALLHITYPDKQIIIITNAKWVETIKQKHEYAFVFDIQSDDYISLLKA